MAKSLTESWLLANGVDRATLDAALAAAPAPAKAGGRAKAADAPTLLAPGGLARWEVEIAGWVPPNLNRMLYKHWSRARNLKRGVAGVVAVECLRAGVARASGRRKLSIEVRTPPGRKHPDHDNILKALLDALRDCGAIVDDGPDHLEIGPYAPTTGRLATILTIEDLEGPTRAEA